MAGLLVQKELQIHGRLPWIAPKRPLVAILGGAKVAAKIGVINNLLEKADTIHHRRRHVLHLSEPPRAARIGNSLLEADQRGLRPADDADQASQDKGVKLLLPLDNLAAEEFSADATPVAGGRRRTIPEDLMGMDIGPKTIATVSPTAVQGAGTVIWNGPMGVFEFPAFAQGTRAVAAGHGRASRRCHHRGRGGLRLRGGTDGSGPSALPHLHRRRRFSGIPGRPRPPRHRLPGRQGTGRRERGFMNRKYRKTIIAGNWKMHKTATETKRFAERLKGALPRSKRCSIVLCVPYVDIPAAVKLLKDSRVAVGAQNLHWEASGPFTGEISAAMLADLDVKYVIIGHSERRAHFGESDLIINKKIHAALAAGLRPILCVGEDLAQRQLGVTLEFITYQLKAALAGVSPEAMRRVVIAYEPIWAIGTGNTATPEQAGEVCAAIRGVLRKLYGARIARSTTIQYGGSMNETNAEALLHQEDVDGGLIGTAALDPEKFLQIIQTANQD